VAARAGSITTPARVVAIDPDPPKREAAMSHGAAMAFDPSEPDAPKRIGKACRFEIAAALGFRRR
jgi:threonine dehydrogenase-like Zn-dependent dehydrogenase